MFKRLRELMASFSVGKVLGALLTIAVTAYVAYDQASLQAVKDRKAAVLDEIAAYRYLLHPSYTCVHMDQLVAALNRAIIIFAEHDKVVRDILGILDADSREGAQDRLDKAIVRMAEETDIPASRLGSSDLPGFTAQRCP